MENIRIKKISVPEGIHPLEQMRAFGSEIGSALIFLDSAIMAELEKASLAQKDDNGIYTLEPWGGSGIVREFSKDKYILVNAKLENGIEYNKIPQKPDRILMFAK